MKLTPCYFGYQNLLFDGEIKLILLVYFSAESALRKKCCDKFMGTRLYFNTAGSKPVSGLRRKVLEEKRSKVCFKLGKCASSWGSVPKAEKV